MEDIVIRNLCKSFAGKPVLRDFSAVLRVAILRALLAEYDLLFLDEPFKGLDRETKETVMADTRRRCAGRTVLLVTHDVAELDAMGAVVRLDLST